MIRPLLRLLRGEHPALQPSEWDGFRPDWDGVLHEAVRHRVAPLLYRTLAALSPSSSIPVSALDTLREAYRRTTLHNALLLRELASVLSALDERGIDAIALKGIAMLDVYGDAGVRSMTDIDILVRPQALGAAQRALIAVGFVSEPGPDIEEQAASSHHIAPLERSGTYVEVHWTIERPSSPFRIDLDGLWARARTVDTRGVRMRVPAPEDMIFHLCLHLAYHHRFERAAVKQLCDVAALSRRFADSLDWALVARIARESGAQSFVRCTLRLAQELLGVEVPQWALQALQKTSIEDGIVNAAKNCILTPAQQLPAAYDEIARRSTRMDRVKLVARTLFPGRRVIESVHGLRAGSRWWYLYAALRPFDLLLRRGRIGAQILSRSPEIRPTLNRELDRRRIYRWIDAADAG
jgi:hypothetical protein